MSAHQDLVRCVWCGGTTEEGSVCPRSIPCPTCGSKSGQRCQRPSGHLTDTLHIGRIHAAEEMDRAKGIVYGG